MKKRDPVSLEILSAIGAWTLHNAQGKPTEARRIFKCLVPQFEGRYPHHKLLSHWCSEAEKPFRVVPDAEKVQICVVAYRLSAKLPSGEVLSFDQDDAQELAEELHKRGFTLDEITNAVNEDDNEQARIVSAFASVNIFSRMRRLESKEWREESSEMTMPAEPDGQ